MAPAENVRLFIQRFMSNARTESYDSLTKYIDDQFELIVYNDVTKKQVIVYDKRNPQKNVVYNNIENAIKNIMINKRK